MLFTCIKSWFFRNHLANFHQISHWSFCWNVIDSLFKWSCSIDCQAHIFFFKTKNCSNDDIFISCDDRIGKMLHNICMSAVAMSLRWANHGPWASCYYFSKKTSCGSLEALHQGFQGDFKAQYSSKVDIFIQEKFHKLIYGINTIIKCGIGQHVKLCLSPLGLGDILFFPWASVYLSVCLSVCHTRVHSITWKLFKLSSQNFI